MSKPNVYVSGARTSIGSTVPQPEERPYGTPPPVSPTGAPRLPRSVVPWLLLVAPSAAAGLAVAAQGAEDPTARLVFAALTAAVSTVPGILSQGWRR